MRDEISLELLEQIEHQFDSIFSTQSLSFDSRQHSLLAFWMVSEDLHRWLLADAASTWLTSDRNTKSGFIVRLDRYKYSAKQAIQHIFRNSLFGGTAPKKLRITIHQYEDCVRFLVAAEEYAEIARIFSSVRAGERTLYLEHGSDVIIEQTDDHKLQYAALELVTHEAEYLTPISQQILLFGGPSRRAGLTQDMEWAPWVRDFIRRVKSRRGRVGPTLHRAAVREFFEGMAEQPSPWPEHWQFPWGSATEVRSYFDALASMLLAHSVAVHFVSQRDKIPSGAFHQFCLLSSFDTLNYEISAISLLPIGTVEAITHALILGNGTTAPDPALQPITPLPDGGLVVPPIFTISSNWARNTLSLHARVSPSTFDSQSSIFEQKMIGDISNGIIGTCEKFLTNIMLKLGDRREEVDLIIVDTRSKTLLMCELRWMIQPGDIREVLQRQRVLAEKVAQIERKCRSARSNIAAVERSIGLRELEGWKLLGIVVVEGFGGVRSPKPKEFPIVPAAAFMAGLKAVRELDRLHEIFCSGAWLPRDGKDIRLSESEVVYLGKTFRRRGFERGNEDYMRNIQTYFSDAATSDDALKKYQW